MRRKTPRCVEWVESDASFEFPAAAGRAAPPAGQSHHVALLVASYDAPSGVSGVARILADADVIFRTDVHGALALEFSAPLRLPAGAALTADLTGSVVEARVNIAGYTL